MKGLSVATALQQVWWSVPRDTQLMMHSLVGTRIEPSLLAALAALPDGDHRLRTIDMTTRAVKRLTASEKRAQALAYYADSERVLSDEQKALALGMLYPAHRDATDSVEHALAAADVHSVQLFEELVRETMEKNKRKRR